MTIASAPQSTGSARLKSDAVRPESGPPLDRITGSPSTLDNLPANPVAEPDRKLSEVAYRFELQNIARTLKPNSRLRVCLRDKIPGRELVEVWRDPQRRKAYYQNLMTCNRVYLCPVCAARITERRRKELTALLGQGETIQAPDKTGKLRMVVVPKFHMGMATYTISHSKNESAAAVLDRLSRAYKKFWSSGGREVNALRQQYRILGTIRALEVVYGDNGFHFHYHVLYICDSVIVPMVEAQLHYALGTRWLESVHRVGGVASIDAFDFTAGDSALSEYISKIGQIVGEAGKAWGQVAEVTKYPTKRQNKAGLTLWELLESHSRGDKRAGAVWNEIIDALHGKTYLEVSNGLLKRLGGNPDIASDEKMAEQEIEDTDAMFAAIGDQSWKLIKKHSKRSELLEFARSGDVEGFQKYLESIEGTLTTGDLNADKYSSVKINAGQGVVYGSAIADCGDAAEDSNQTKEDDYADLNQVLW